MSCRCPSDYALLEVEFQDAELCVELEVRRGYQAVEEVVSLHDVVLVTLTRPLADISSSVDAVAKKVTRPVADAFTAAEAVTKKLTRTVAEVSTTVDAISASGRLIDGSTTADSVSKRVTKVIAEVSSTADAVTVSDAHQNTDHSATTDSGAVYQLNYVSPYYGYFASVYVIADSRTF